MPQQVETLALLAFTTGAGIALGTGNSCKIGGVYIGSVATTVTIKSGTATQIELTASQSFPNLLQLAAGAATMTSSGGSAAIAYYNR